MKLECQIVLITWGPFLNYVEQILPIINHLPFGEGIPLLLHIGGNLPIVYIFTYLLTYLVFLNVVKEQPPSTYIKVTTWIS